MYCRGKGGKVKGKSKSRWEATLEQQEVGLGALIGGCQLGPHYAERCEKQYEMIENM